MLPIAIPTFPTPCSKEICQAQGLGPPSTFKLLHVPGERLALKWLTALHVWVGPCPIGVVDQCL